MPEGSLNLSSGLSYVHKNMTNVPTFLSAIGECLRRAGKIFYARRLLEWET